LNKTIRLRKIIVLVLDVLLMGLSLYVALLLRRGNLPSMGLLEDSALVFGPVFVIWVLTLYLSGLYSLQDPRSFLERVPNVLRAFAIAAGASIALLYLWNPPGYSPKTILAYFTVLFLVLFLLGRQFHRFWAKEGHRVVRAGVIGWDPVVLEMLHEGNRSGLFPLELALVYNEVVDTSIPNAIPQVQDLAQVQHELDRGIDLLVIAPRLNHNAAVHELLFHNLSAGLVYASLPEMYEIVCRRIPINTINQMWFLEHLKLRDKIPFELVKRVADFSLAFVASVIVLPICLLVWVGVKVTSSGPGVFTQTRLGRLGKPFTICKFRTMKVENNSFAMTVAGDNRITGFGKFLRTSRLDELPQLFNILRGDMSFVGPRPERPELVTDLERGVPFYRQRLLVVPGLTGWDQICGEYHGASVEDTAKKMQYDLYYIKNRSVYLDFMILLKTVSTVLGRVGR